VEGLSGHNGGIGKQARGQRRPELRDGWEAACLLLVNDFVVVPDALHVGPVAELLFGENPQEPLGDPLDLALGLAVAVPYGDSAAPVSQRQYHSTHILFVIFLIVLVLFSLSLSLCIPRRKQFFHI